MTSIREPLRNVSKLGDLLDLIIDYRGKTPKKLGGDFSDSGVPVISAIHIKRGKIVWEERERFVTRDLFQKWMKDPLKKGDVLLTSEAPLGEVALVPSDEDLVLSQRLFALRTKPELLDSKYLMYFLQSSFGQEELKSRSSGSTVVGIRQAELINIEVPCPPITHQRVIGEVLANIDAKISTNENLTEILEDLTQTIFNSWFINFDPVKAKMAGEKPAGMDDTTASLFPDSMEESELGLIPKGWKVTALVDVCSTTIGGLWGNDEKSLENPESYLCIRGVDMDDLKSLGYAPRVPIRWEKAQNYEKRLLRGTQILIAGSGAGPVAKSLLWDEQMNFLFSKPVVFSNFVKRFECNTNEMATFVSSILTTMYDSREIFTFVNGTSVPNLQDRELLTSKRVALPPKDLLRVFDDIKRTSIKLKYVGENSKLVAIRDSLLPRLISGELQIPEEMLAS